MSEPLARRRTPSRRRWWTLVVVALAQLMVVLDATVVNIALPVRPGRPRLLRRRPPVDRHRLLARLRQPAAARRPPLRPHRPQAHLHHRPHRLRRSPRPSAARPDSFELLVAARALQGAFGALLAPTALAVLTTTFTIPKERARAFGVFGAIAGAGGAVGLLLGGFLTETLDWRWNLYINVFIAVVAIVGAAALRAAPSRAPARARSSTSPAPLLVSGALFALVYGFSNAETDGWDSPLTWGLLAARRRAAGRVRALAAPRRAPAAAAADRARPQPRRRLHLGADRRRRACSASSCSSPTTCRPRSATRPIQTGSRVPADDRDAGARRAARHQLPRAALRPEDHGARSA